MDSCSENKNENESGEKPMCNLNMEELIGKWLYLTGGQETKVIDFYRKEVDQIIPEQKKQAGRILQHLYFQSNTLFQNLNVE